MDQVTEVKDGGACSGHLDVGDRITHVDNVSVVGKEPQAVIERCGSLLKVLLTIERKNSGQL